MAQGPMSTHKNTRLYMYTYIHTYIHTFSSSHIPARVYSRHATKCP
jgi:hypothetical protein